MVIRSFCLADCARVPQLFEEALSEECYKETITAFASQLAWDSELILVASVDNEVVGAAIGTIEKDHGLYHRVVVAPAYRNIGIGKQLVEKLQHRFIQRKVKSITVKNDSYNMPLLNIWQKMNNHFDNSQQVVGEFKLASRI
jgi:GNAT superfamily N-acetyltransferase